MKNVALTALVLVMVGFLGLIALIIWAAQTTTIPEGTDLRLG